MNSAGDVAPDAFQDALIAARLCAIDPELGGIVLRGGGELRDAVIAELRTGLPTSAPVRRLPSHIDDERLLGGIDLTATLAQGKRVTRAGLFAEADGGIIIVPMAERLSDATVGRITAVMDAGTAATERDGVAARYGARFLTVAFDDGIEPEERAPAALIERVAFWIDLTASRALSLHGGDWALDPPATEALLAIQRFYGGTPAVQAPDEIVSALATTAAALGIDSARAPLFALRAARASARLAGRTTVADEDVLLAARLVLAPRATRLPMAPAEPEADSTPPPPQDSDAGEDENGEQAPLEDLVLAAALASLPKDVLARIAAGTVRRGRPNNVRGAGARQKSGVRGRPMGARAGMPGGGQRLSLIDTLRSAAPWQKLRGTDGRIAVRRDDLRVRRFETRAEALTIFAVDASGSSALARLAEAKGAVELLLAEAYVKRAQVALIAFRGTLAEVLLPPTRSLARARRSLAELPGGGGTPLAAGLNAARELAEAARARGQTPFIVVLTDGRANIAADGGSVRAAAEADAKEAAKAIGTAGIAAAFVDISARPRPEGAALAAAMRARYLPLPRADATTMHAAVSAAQRA
ncbi:magnesium chelatase subunit D [Polymorphobacter arshaanensis]|uniref:Magnesium chelatase subunit D n=1 Tax=Glacieibacterium arshaanense TaxID=2511025 RepID=A0A4Y9EM19_9SPHN|nr:magnesium chelatase subunit D [Polymorphobacter arshaanensis]TFU03126.1 magnesium chelatase subunit D [Polymorphobacter arshaanensis]